MRIPPVLIEKSKSLQVKLALILENEHTPGGCENCGGTGYIAIFLATNGPFESPGAPGKYVSKWHNGAWWCAPSGDVNFGTCHATCPVCGGLKIQTGNRFVSPPANPVKQLVQRMSK